MGFLPASVAPGLALLTVGLKAELEPSGLNSQCVWALDAIDWEGGGTGDASKNLVKQLLLPSSAQGSFAHCSVH